jgi:molybdate transport system substrate-binding protein
MRVRELTMKALWRLAAVSLFLLIVSAASCSKQAPRRAQDDTATEPKATPIVVSVAASTRDVVEELSQQFDQDAGVDVKVNAGASNELATQILAGAPVDVFLSASTEWADKLKQERRAAATSELLTNRLVVIVPKGNPAGVHESNDLLSASVQKLALAGENVPAGRYADRALAKLGLLEQLSGAKKIVRGEDVRAAASFVERGEAEAGVVYATDARTVPGVEVAFEFDPALHDKIVYALVLVKNDPAKPAARRYYDFLRNRQAADAFARAGFTPIASERSAADLN